MVLGYAYASAVHRKAPAIAGEDFLVGIYRVLGESGLNLFDHPDRAKKIITDTCPGEIRIEDVFTPPDVWKGEPKRACSEVMGYAGVPLQLCRDLQLVLRDAEAMARARSTSRIGLNELLQALRRAEVTTQFLQKYGISFRQNQEIP